MSKERKEVVISTSGINCYGFRVLTEGIDLSQYKKNPVMLWLHTRAWRGTKDEILPIGRIENLRRDGDKLIGTPVFDEEDEFAQSIKKKWDNGFIKMASPGLDIIEKSEDRQYLLPGQTRATVTKSKLTEVSLVDIGGNDEALSLTYNGEQITLSQGQESSAVPLIKIKEEDMSKIALKLGLDEKASEADMLAAIGTLQDQAQASTTLRQENKTLKEARITETVNLAKTEGRITDDRVSHFVELGNKVGLETLQVTLSAIPKPSKLSAQLSGGAPSTQKEITMDEFQKLSVTEQVKFKQENPEGYLALVKSM